MLAKKYLIGKRKGHCPAVIVTADKCIPIPTLHTRTPLKDQAPDIPSFGLLIRRSPK
jgi:hypothetical protein